MGQGAVGASVPVPWDALRAWIDTQEYHEGQGNHSALSSKQLAALSLFVEFIGEEPDVGDSDYVSKLMHLTQARCLAAPVFRDLEPVDVPVGGAPSTRWRTVCILPSSGHKELPAVGYGLEDGQMAPMFKSKKVAKQYAAKHAFAYLSGHPPVRPTPPSSVRTSSGSDITQLWAPETPDAAVEPPGSVSIKRSHSEFESDEGPSVFSKVSALAGRMGFDNPTYQIDAEGESGNMFSGRPIFRNGGRIPWDLGKVTGVYGKKEARKQVAEAVLAWLEEENDRRIRISSKLLEGL